MSETERCINLMSDCELAMFNAIGGKLKYLQRERAKSYIQPLQRERIVNLAIERLRIEQAREERVA